LSRCRQRSASVELQFRKLLRLFLLLLFSFFQTALNIGRGKRTSDIPTRSAGVNQSSFKMVARPFWTGLYLKLLSSCKSFDRVSISGLLVLFKRSFISFFSSFSIHILDTLDFSSLHPFSFPFSPYLFPTALRSYTHSFT